MKHAGRRLVLASLVLVLQGVRSASVAGALTGFVLPIPNPFGIGDQGIVTAPTFADIDGDGDQDAFVGGFDGFVRFYENVGSATLPSFAFVPGQPGFQGVGGHSIPAFVDIDGDGDLDGLVGSISGDIMFFENVGTSTAPAFPAVPVPNPFGLVDVGMLSGPAFADLDADGDLDGLVGNLVAEVIFFENVGTATAPAFAAPVTNPFGLTGFGQVGVPAVVDFDEDGDLDVFVAGSGKRYFENVGGPSSPAFAPPLANPFGLTDQSPRREVLAFADVDADGHVDVFDGAGDVTLWFPRRGCPLVPSGGCTGGFERQELTIRETNELRRSLGLKLLRGPDLQRADFGDPTVSGGTAYHVCLYDDAGVLWANLELARAGEVCGVTDCWRTIPGLRGGYRYRDPTGAAVGVNLVRMQEGDAGTSRIVVKTRRGVELPIGLADALGTTATVRVDVLGSDAPRCFTDTLTAVVQTPGVIVAK
jgi:hypothetical protein